jgi:fibronectin-binding autotransporter adhesin
LVTFDDNALGTTTVNLVTTVNPANVTVNNSSLSYTFSGSGKISGTTGLTKEGAGTFAIANTGGNNYTGPTAISGGVLSVTSLANGGSPSAIGASSSDPTNLVINGGTLSYAGAPVSVNRSFTVGATNATIDAESNLTVSGRVVAVPNPADGGSAFTKTGPAQFTLTTAGTNEFASGFDPGVQVLAGTMLLDGSAGGQTNHTQFDMWIGSTPASGASVVLTNTTFHVDGWLAIGRINGGINNTSTLSLYNSAMTVGNVSLGWDGGLPGNLSSQFLTLNGNSALTNYGSVNLAEGANASFTLNVSNNSVFWVQNPFYICFNANTTGTVEVANSGKIISANGWFDIGQGNNCVASLLAKDNASLSVNNGDLNLADTAGGAMATLTVQDHATVQANTLWVGKSSSSVCTATIAGSAAANFNNYIDLASGSGSIGNVNMLGGSLTSGGDMTVGDQGTAVLNMVANSGAVLTVHGTLYLSRSSQVANGTVNLNAGTTIVAGYVNNGWGFQNGFASPLDNPNAFNFNGGTLRAYVGSPYFIQPYVNAVVQSGGAIIDDGGYSVEVLTALVDGGGGGGLTKLGQGTLQLDGVNTYTGSTVVSNGTLQVGSGGVIAGHVTVASGATLAGGAPALETYYINNTLTLSAGSTALFRITPTGNDQIAGLTGVSYGGALVVSNISPTPLTPGTVFKLFSSASAGTSNFSSVTLLPAGSATFNSATGELTIISVVPFSLNPPLYSGGNLILTATGGTPGGSYTLLTSTNIITPLAAWTTNSTGFLNGSGGFSNSIPVNTSERVRFFDLRMP